MCPMDTRARDRLLYFQWLSSGRRIARLIVVSNYCMNASLSLGLVCVCVSGLSGATLQQLSLDDMTQKSTMIVQGMVQGPVTTALHSRVIFSHYQIQVSAVWKGQVGSTVDLAVPGGIFNGVQQSYSGAPALQLGKQYVFFLWTSRNGVTQVIGLSQGLFGISSSQVSRPATTEMLLDRHGQPVTDTDLVMQLSDLRSRVQTVLKGVAQ